MSETPRQITIGWMRSDGDLDVFMTVHIANLDERVPDFCGNMSPVEHFKQLADDIGAVVLVREDMPDTLTLPENEEI